MNKKDLKEFEELNELLSLFEDASLKNEIINFSEDEFERIIYFYLQNNQPHNALNASEMALTIYPFSSEFCLSKADAHIELGELDLAEDYLINNFKIDKTDVDFYIILSEVYVLRNNFEKAIDVCHEGISICHNDLDLIFLHLAEIFDHQGEYQEVIPLLETALKINSKNEDAIYLYALTMSILDKTTEKIQFFLKLIDQDPFNEDVWYYLSVAYRENANYDKAIEALEYLGAIDEESNIMGDMATIYFDSGRYSQAIDCLKELERDGNLESMDYLIFAKSYKALGNHYKARLYFKEALSLDEENDIIYYELAQLFYEEKKYTAALPLINKALEKANDTAHYLELKADIMFGLEQIDLACAIYQHIIQLNNSTSYFLSKFAYVTAIRFGLNEAINLLDKGIEDYQHDSLYYHKAVLYFIFNKEEDGLVEFAKGLEHDYESHTILFEKMPDLTNNKKILSLLSLYE